MWPLECFTKENIDTHLWTAKNQEFSNYDTIVNCTFIFIGTTQIKLLKTALVLLFFYNITLEFQTVQLNMSALMYKVENSWRHRPSTDPSYYLFHSISSLNVRVLLKRERQHAKTYWAENKLRACNTKKRTQWLSIGTSCFCVPVTKHTTHIRFYIHFLVKVQTKTTNKMIYF